MANNRKKDKKESNGPIQPKITRIINPSINPANAVNICRESYGYSLLIFNLPSAPYDLTHQSLRSAVKESIRLLGLTDAKIIIYKHHRFQIDLGYDYEKSLPTHLGRPIDFKWTIDAIMDSINKPKFNRPAFFNTIPH